MAGGPRKMAFSTLAKAADRKEHRRMKQDTRSILIVLSAILGLLWFRH